MDIQFEKVVLPCIQTVLQEVKEQEKSGEIKLIDEMPDIGRIIMSWGQVLLRGKEWRGDAVGLNSGIMVWVLYEPEEGGAPGCAQTWMPLQMNWDMENTDRDGNVIFQPLLKALDVRAVSARKMAVRASVGVQAIAQLPSEVVANRPVEVPEDIHVLDADYIVSIPMESGEKMFAVEEQLELPGDIPELDTVVSYCVHPTVAEQKIMGDKLILRGTSDLHLVYLSQEGAVCSWDFSMPYSQYTQLDREYSGNAEAMILPVITALELEKSEDGKLSWKVGICAQFTVYDKTAVSVVSDAYSNQRELTCRVEALNLPSVLCRETVALEPVQRMDFEGVRTADAMFYPDHPRVNSTENGFKVDLSGVFRLVGYDNTGKLCSSVKKWETVHTISAASDCIQSAQVIPGGKITTIFTGAGTELRCQLPLALTTISGRGIPMVTQLAGAQEKEKDPGRPALVIKRVGEMSLWEHAKLSGSTVEAIREVNGVGQELTGDKMLLIPVE